MKKILEDNEVYTLSFSSGYTKFKGCQCFGDCSCQENFRSEYYEFYAVFKKIGKKKTTHYPTLEEARERINFLISSIFNKA